MFTPRQVKTYEEGSGDGPVWKLLQVLYYCMWHCEQTHGGANPKQTDKSAVHWHHQLADAVVLTDEDKRWRDQKILKFHKATAKVAVKKESWPQRAVYAGWVADSEACIPWFLAIPVGRSDDVVREGLVRDEQQMAGNPFLGGAGAAGQVKLLQCLIYTWSFIYYIYNEM